MTCYFLAQIRIDDRAEYRKYLDTCDEVFARFNGTYLAVDGAPVVLEGTWDYSRTVLIAFPSENDLRRWYRSDDYQEILKHRLAGARCNTVMVRGLDD